MPTNSLAQSFLLQVQSLLHNRKWSVQKKKACHCGKYALSKMKDKKSRESGERCVFFHMLDLQ